MKIVLSCQNIKDCSKVRNNGTCANLLNFFNKLADVQLLTIYSQFSVFICGSAFLFTAVEATIISVVPTHTQSQNLI